MTAGDFLAFYPAFSPFSGGAVLAEYVRQANARFGDFGADAEEARRLFTAHRLTLYAASALPEGAAPSPAAIAAAGRGVLQEVSSKKAGDVSVSYDTSSSVSATVRTGLSDLKETVYGLQLLTLLRLYGFTRYYP